MTDGQVFIFAAIAGLVLYAILEHLWLNRSAKRKEQKT